MVLLGFLSFQINRNLYNNLNLLNIILSIIPLLYFNILFLGFVRIISKFRFRKVLQNFFAYFQLRFLRKLKETNIFDEIGLEYSQTTDHLEKLIYIGQFLKKAESLCMNLTNRMWSLMFYPFLIAAGLVMTKRVLMVFEVENNFGTFGRILENLVLSYNHKSGVRSHTERLEDVATMLIEIQKIIILLIIVDIFIHYYSNLRDNIKQLPSDHLSEYIDYFDSKIDLMLNINTNWERTANKRNQVEEF